MRKAVGLEENVAGRAKLVCSLGCVDAIAAEECSFLGYFLTFLNGLT